MVVAPGWLFVLSVVLFAAFPVAFTFLGRTTNFVLAYGYFASLLTVGGFFGAVYSLPVGGSLTVSAGSVLYAALVYASLVLVVNAQDARVVRDIIRLVVAVDMFQIVLLALAGAALRSPGVINPFGTDPGVFTLSFRGVVAGGVLIVAELVLVIFAFERVKARFRGRFSLALSYVALFVVVLVLDGVLFPLLALTPVDNVRGLILAGLRVKLLLAGAFGVPLLLYLLLARRTLAHYVDVAMPLHQLFLAPREDLLQEIARQRQALADEAERYRWLVDSTADAVVGTSLAGEVQSWNRAACQLYRRAPDEAKGQPVGQLIATLRRGEVEALLAGVAERRTVSDRETTVYRPDGSAVEVSLTVSPVLDRGGQVAGVSWIGRDVSDRHRVQRAMEHQATHDGLTGLPNRHLLADRLQHAFDSSRRRGTTLALLFVDLDRFKMVNDSSGHLAGDQLLVEVADRFRDVLRSGETLARFGGDEFVVLCEDSDAEGAARVAGRLLNALGKSFRVPTGQVHMSASIGIAVAPPGDPQSLQMWADVAMYEAKSRGRGRVETFDPSMATRTKGRLELAHDLRQALADEGLALHYQPLVCLADGQILGLEALARWRHPQRGQVPPNLFVPVAEEAGLVVGLDRWALRRAVADGSRLLAAGALPTDSYVSVNLSAHTVADTTLVELVRDLLAAGVNGFESRNLAIEVTESLVMNDMEASIRALQELRELGVRVLIDDFGTGYSSLTYLRRLPTSIVKIDRSFITGVTSGHQDLAIVSSIVHLAHGLGLRVVAEGVETTAQCAVLRASGCDAGQGFLWSPGVPVQELTRLVTDLPKGRFPVV